MKKIFLLILPAILLSWQEVSSQNIGIGTTNPTRAKLEVHGGVGATSAIFGGETSGVSIHKNWPGLGFNMYHNNEHKLLTNGTGAVQTYNPDGGYMAFDMYSWGMADQSPSNRRALALFHTGRVNIGGGYAPASTLHVARGDGPDGTAVFSGTSFPSHFNFGSDENTYIRAGKTNGTVFINDIPGSKVSLSGNVGINTPTPAYPLEIWQPVADKGLAIVNSNNLVDWEFRVTGALGYLRMYYNGSYSGEFNNNGVYSHTSDRRLKTKINKLPSVLDKVMQLDPVDYEMINNNPNHERNIGFIAQDVKTLFPELVSVAHDTASGHKGISDVHTLDYSGFGVLAIKAIQEQQQQITELKKELALLKEQNKLIMQTRFY